MRSVFLIALCVSLTACSSRGGLIQANVHPLKSYSSLQYLSCDSTSHFPEDKKAALEFRPDPQKQATAIKAYKYALLSSNVYRSPVDKPIFNIDGLSEPVRYESMSGLAAEVYRVHREKALTEIIVVFKGTDFSSLHDWANNISLYFEPTQYREARELVEALLKEEKSSKTKITVTGHSLGGGIALNMSFLFDGVNAVVFNTSPRAFYAANSDYKNERILISESGEALKGVRWFWQRKLSGLNSTEFNFLKFNGWARKLINEHGMYYLSRGILLYAVGSGDGEAASIFTQNIITNDYQDKLNMTADYAHDIEACELLRVAAHNYSFKANVADAPQP